MDREYKKIIQNEAKHGIHEAWRLKLRPSWAKSTAGRKKRAHAVKLRERRNAESHAVAVKVKAKLEAGGFKVWQLASAMNKPRMTYYHWRYHRTLGRHREAIDAGLLKLKKHPERYRGTGSNVKATLKKHGLTVSNLCQALGVPRATYYTWCRHPGFNGHEKDVRNAVDHLVATVRKMP